MNGKQKTRDELIEELAQLRAQVANLETQLASSQQADFQASEAKYRRLHQTMRDAFVSVDMNGHIQEFNDAYREMLGYEADELPSLTYIDITPEKWHAFEAEIVREQILPRGYSGTYEKEYLRKDGTVFPVELRTCLISDNEGKPCAMWAIVRDITEHKQMEKKLQEANERLEQRVRERTAELSETNDELLVFKTFADASGEGFGMLDLDGRIIYSNTALARLVGEAKPEDVCGRQPSFYYSEDQQEPKSAEAFPIHQGSGPWQGELNLVSVTGEKIPVLQTSFTLVDQQGQPTGRGMVVTDLRKSKRAEASLQQRLTELQAIYDGMSDGLVLVDLATRRFLRTNPAFCQMVGYSQDELLSLTVNDVHPSDSLSRVHEAVLSLAKGNRVWAAHMPVLRSDGTIFQADISVTPISIGGEQFAVSFFRDITERKEAQESLYRMLQASDHERELITYEIHDGVAQQLLGAKIHFEAVAQKDDSMAKEILPTFRAGLAALQQASEEARSFMNRTRTPVLQRFGVRQAVADFIDQYLGQEGAPEIIYHCEARFGRLEPVLENTIFRVTQEAIINACKHSNADVIRVSIIQQDDELTIEVQDDGVGFDTSKVTENCFGLHGIRERARLLGKYQAIESKPGRGTRVEAVFPLVPRAAEEH